MSSVISNVSYPLLLIYDQQCPACHFYCQLIRIQKTIGELKLIDARQDSDVMKEITGCGLDIDQGMVLKMGEQWYYGSDAMHALALISSRSGVFNRVNYWIFSSKSLSALLYPGLRWMRNLLLKLLGKTRINNLQIEGNDRF